MAQAGTASADGRRARARAVALSVDDYAGDRRDLLAGAARQVERQSLPRSPRDNEADMNARANIEPLALTNAPRALDRFLRKRLLAQLVGLRGGRLTLR